ncbi:GNAT family N-acetyltransferase [Actinoplanes sp. HUAS TT8]|uniref:GNAT family N-acetyltransferase n=1 Tax=Actinoplanes sp. HUAS TT8 TaxID=3447453 RepID=UPI003F52360B
MTGWLQPHLEGDRVRLRPPARGDEPELIEMATDTRVRRYIGGPVDQATAAAVAARKVSTPVWGEFVIVDRATSEVAGSGSLARKRGPWEISYQLRCCFWHKGYANPPVLHQMGAAVPCQGGERCRSGLMANLPPDL